MKDDKKKMVMSSLLGCEQFIWLGNVSKASSK